MPVIFSYIIYCSVSEYSSSWDVFLELLSRLLPPRYSLGMLLGERCKDGLCIQYLSQNDRDAFDLCTKRSQAEPRLTDVVESACHFMNQSSRAPVALVSYPGSGNTWTRGLLQRATGICTGSVYCDSWLRAHGFPGESIRSGSVLVTKTHYPSVKIARRIECPPPLWSTTGGNEGTETLYRDFESPRWGYVSKNSSFSRLRGRPRYEAKFLVGSVV